MITLNTFNLFNKSGMLRMQINSIGLLVSISWTQLLYWIVVSTYSAIRFVNYLRVVIVFNDIGAKQFMHFFGKDETKVTCTNDIRNKKKNKNSCKLYPRYYLSFAKFIEFSDKKSAEMIIQKCNLLCCRPKSCNTSTFPEFLTVFGVSIEDL